MKKATLKSLSPKHPLLRRLAISVLLFSAFANACSTEKPKVKEEVLPTPEPTEAPPTPVLTEIGVWFTGELSAKPEVISIKENHLVRESSYTIQMVCHDPIEKKTVLIKSTTSMTKTATTMTIGALPEESDPLGAAGNDIPCKIAASPEREVLYKYDSGKDQLSFVDEAGKTLQSFARTEEDVPEY